MKKEEYEAVYAEHIPAMNKARESGDFVAYNHHSEVVYNAAKGLVSTAVYDGLKITGVQSDAGTAEVAVNAALAHILTDMAPGWDPESGTPFTRILNAKKASWREEASKAARENESNFKFTAAESNLLRIAGGISNDYLAEHGKEMPRSELIDTIKDRKAALEAADDQAAARNVKKGFNAAVENAHALLGAAATVTSFDQNWDEEESTDLEASSAFQNSGAGEDLGWGVKVESMARLAGVNLDSLFGDGESAGSLNAKARERALQRLASPHAQWVFTQR